MTCFDSFGVECIPKEIKQFVSNKNIKTNIDRRKENGSIICGYFCIVFADFMLKGKILLDYTNFFPPNEHGKNNTEMVLKVFQ